MDDSITNLLVSLKTASISHKYIAKVRATNINEVILRKLEQEGFISGFDYNCLNFWVTLQHGFPIKTLKQVSTRGNRKFFSHGQLQKSNAVWGLISTAKGLLTIREALEYGIGGEVILWILEL